MLIFCLFAGDLLGPVRIEIDKKPIVSQASEITPTRQLFPSAQAPQRNEAVDEVQYSAYLAKRPDIVSLVPSWGRTKKKAQDLTNILETARSKTFTAKDENIGNSFFIVGEYDVKRWNGIFRVKKQGTTKAYYYMVAVQNAMTENSRNNFIRNLLAVFDHRAEIFANFSPKSESRGQEPKIPDSDEKKNEEAWRIDDNYQLIKLVREKEKTPPRIIEAAQPKTSPKENKWLRWLQGGYQWVTESPERMAAAGVATVLAAVALTPRKSS